MLNIDAQRIIVISGPSGVGKSTVVSQVLAKSPVPIELSVSATTRQPRRGEVDGRDYLFLTPEEFQKRRENGEFLECKEVFSRGDWYGTLKSSVASGLSAGKWVLLEIDVQGALAVKQEYPEILMIFLHPGCMETLEKRLRNRRSDSEASIQRRLEVAARELSQTDKYDHVFENETVEQTVDQICDAIRQRMAA